MEWMRRSVAMGCRNANEFRIESALDPLRSRDDFRLMMMDLAMPADPFAGAWQRSSHYDRTLAG
jgi:hypothetical protein